LTSIQQALDRVRQRITSAALAAGREPAQVRLLAVSKTKPAECIREAYAAGQRDFGENYLKELERKAEALADLVEIRWHVIGHLQSNKLKLAARHAALVHTVDSAHIAEALGRRREQAEHALGSDPSSSGRLAVLVQVNLGAEAQKAGCRVDQLTDVLSAVELQRALVLRGLMTVPPSVAEPAAARPYFERLRELQELHGGASRLPELSMGMSHDLEVAIASGATVVRVGTAIFGTRVDAPRAAP
jgi:hypothetical protein